nr:hypothetical protein [Pandoravirus aubagnensis]
MHADGAVRLWSRCDGTRAAWLVENLRAVCTAHGPRVERTRTHTHTTGTFFTLSFPSCGLSLFFPFFFLSAAALSLRKKRKFGKKRETCRQVCCASGRGS